MYQRITEDTVDAAETIVQCSKHMKKTVNGEQDSNTYKPPTNQSRNAKDVLTVSKFDSRLFTMTPVEVQLDSIARNAIKMFEGEARSAGIELKITSMSPAEHSVLTLYHSIPLGYCRY